MTASSKRVDAAAASVLANEEQMSAYPTPISPLLPETMERALAQMAAVHMMPRIRERLDGATMRREIEVLRATLRVVRALAVHEYHNVSLETRYVKQHMDRSLCGGCRQMDIVDAALADEQP